MQAVALHPEVIVARSVKWQTSCTLLHHGDETFLVDSVIYPSELELLPGLLSNMPAPPDCRPALYASQMANSDAVPVPSTNIQIVELKRDFMPSSKNQTRDAYGYA